MSEVRSSFTPKQSYQYRIGIGCIGRYEPFRSLNGANSSLFRFVIYFARHRFDPLVSSCFSCTVRNFVFRSVHHFHPSSLAFSLLSFFFYYYIVVSPLLGLSTFFLIPLLFSRPNLKKSHSQNFFIFHRIKSRDAALGEERKEDGIEKRFATREYL